MQQISVNIKIVIVGIITDSLVVFVKDNSLPSALVQSKKTLDEQVNALFLETTGLSLGNNYSEQLYTIATTENEEVSIVYYVLIPLDQQKNIIAPWKKIMQAGLIANDKAILTYALQRLQWKIEYTNVVYSLLPKEFTLSELQKTYEAILDESLDKRNFRKKILSLNFLEPTGKKRIGVSRPAQVYTFKKRTPTFIKIFS